MIKVSLPRLRLSSLLLVVLAWQPLLRAAEGDLASPPSIDGSWRWTFTMPDGTTSPVKLILETEEGQLTGTTSFRLESEVPITNAVLNGTQLSFQVVRHRADREIVTTYAGTWNRKQILGTVESNWAGEKQSYPWQATRAHEGAEGVWKWSATFRGRKFEARVKLEQEGELLTEVVPGSGRGTRRILISHGSVKNGEVYFEIERGSGENRVLTIYKGKQTGDAIQGTIETVTVDKKSEAPWLARRSE